jgi:hypothetical protein
MNPVNNLSITEGLVKAILDSRSKWEQIDREQQQALAPKHVHMNDDGQWYWVDEVEQPCNDVYQTAEEANLALLSYMKEQELYI